MDLLPLASRLSVELAALQAVLDVESAGQAFGAHGRPIIRVEAHVFWRRVPEHLRARVDASFQVLPGGKPWENHRCLLSGVWTDYHGRQDLEWDAYQLALNIDFEAATEATSWGAGQVLGAHWRRLGFASPAAFVEAQMSEDGQADTLARFIASDSNLLDALRRQDWRTFARGYNGSGQVESYATRLEAAYNRHKGA